ncbi:Nif3-like dinuclear metal center hexameric protein [candidate division KSB1 bacterium]|nr:Nif3-like dinuclear metal center hexameric protein [candidate division KSB1 bacterium]
MAQKKTPRRLFLSRSGAVLGSFALGIPPTRPRSKVQEENPQKTIRAVIDEIILKMTGAPMMNTVDTVKIGDSEQPVTGIACTCMATCKVIQKTAELGYNFIITHEPTFFSHRDQTDWLAENSVYQYKKALLEEHNIVVWRCHDYIHHMQPDGIETGVLERFAWNEYQMPGKSNIFKLPYTPLTDIVAHIKSAFNIPCLRVVGDPHMTCQTVGIMVGAAGGRTQIAFAEHEQPDVLVCGEINEWETCEYIRDAIIAGQKKALIVMGHVNSEELGMKWMSDWLQTWLPGVPVGFVPASDPFIYI